jgi:hypothetical protein
MTDNLASGFQDVDRAENVEVFSGCLTGMVPERSEEPVPVG